MSILLELGICIWEIYILRCSLICKGFLALRILEYKENFCRSLESFVNVTAHDCYASCLDISVDHLWYRYLFCGGQIEFLQGSNLLGGRLWRWLASFLQVDRFIFQWVINCYLCIESFSLNDLHSFSFICDSNLTPVVCFCKWRGHISSFWQQVFTSELLDLAWNCKYVEGSPMYKAAPSIFRYDLQGKYWSLYFHPFVI